MFHVCVNTESLFLKVQQYLVRIIDFLIEKQGFSIYTGLF